MMENIIHNLKIFLMFGLASVKKSFQNRFGAVSFVLAKLIRFTLFFLFAYFLVTKSGSLKGYSVNHIIFFYLTFNIIDTAVQFLYREVYRFQWTLISGEFDSILVKPYHPFLRILVGGVDLFDLVVLIPYIVLAIFFASKLQVITPLNISLYFLLIFNALLIATAFHIGVLAFGILTTEVNQPIWIYRDLTTMGRFPFEIYKEPLRGILTFVIPIGIMMSFPPRALFGALSITLVLYALFISCLLFIGSLSFWKFALKRYQSPGG